MLNTIAAKIHDYLVSGNFGIAKIETELMLKRFPNSALSHYLNARVLAESGEPQKFSDALCAAERAVQLEPNHPLYSEYCGSLFLDLRLYEFALPLLSKSVQLDAHSANSQLRLGDCYFAIGMGEQALNHYRNSLNLEKNTAKRDFVRLKLSICLKTCGQKDEAILLLKRLIRDEGYLYPSALVEMSYMGKESPNSEIGIRIRKSLKSQKISTLDAEKLNLALGMLHQNIGDFDQAFQFWEVSRTLAKSDDIKLLEHTYLFERSKTFYTPELFRATSAHGDFTLKPVFIAAMPRSGSTLTEQIMSAHSQAIGIGELSRWEQLSEALISSYSGNSSFEKIVANSKNGELKERAAELLKIFVLAGGPDKLRIVEKTPHNFAVLGYFHLLCPRAKFIHIRRNPADAFISSYQNAFNRTHSYSYSQDEYAKEYLWHEQMMDLWKSLFPDLILTINYEQLAADPGHVAKKIFEHIGLPWEEQTLRFFENVKTVRTFSTQQVRNPVNTASVDRWRRYEKHLGPLLKALEEAKFEYQYVPV